MIRVKLSQEMLNRDWDHVFYILYEDYQEEHGIPTISPPKREDYIVSIDEEDFVSIKVLGKFGVFFNLDFNLDD